MALPANDVFINVPFDEKHEYLYLLLIAALVGLGLQPRCVLEVPRDHARLHRIYTLIAACPYSIHDLSAVALSAHPFRVPRFNMPFELGLAVAISMATKERHKFRVMDSVPHRITQSLSDIGGYDAFVHNGTPTGTFEAVADMFASLKNPPITDSRDFLLVFRGLKRLRKDRLNGDVFERRHSVASLPRPESWSPQRLGESAPSTLARFSGRKSLRCS